MHPGTERPAPESAAGGRAPDSRVLHDGQFALEQRHSLELGSTRMEAVVRIPLEVQRDVETGNQPVFEQPRFGIDDRS